jgi:hypothetical protein
MPPGKTAGASPLRPDPNHFSMSFSVLPSSGEKNWNSCSLSPSFTSSIVWVPAVISGRSKPSSVAVIVRSGSGNSASEVPFASKSLTMPSVTCGWPSAVGRKHRKM